MVRYTSDAGIGLDDKHSCSSASLVTFSCKNITMSKKFYHKKAKIENILTFNSKNEKLLELTKEVSPFQSLICFKKFK